MRMFSQSWAFSASSSTAWAKSTNLMLPLASRRCWSRGVPLLNSQSSLLRTSMETSWFSYWRTSASYWRSRRISMPSEHCIESYRSPKARFKNSLILWVQFLLSSLLTLLRMKMTRAQITSIFSSRQQLWQWSTWRNPKNFKSCRPIWLHHWISLLRITRPTSWAMPSRSMLFSLLAQTPIVSYMRHSLHQSFRIRKIGANQWNIWYHPLANSWSQWYASSLITSSNTAMK